MNGRVGVQRHGRHIKHLRRGLASIHVPRAAGAHLCQAERGAVLVRAERVAAGGIHFKGLHGRVRLAPCDSALLLSNI